MLRAAYYTLGCKVNQYETERIRLAMERAGFETVPFGSRADVCVINTCTVTAVADAKSRAAIRRAVRANPDAQVIATGCLADLEPDEIAAIDGVDLVVPNESKDSIPATAAADYAGVSRFLLNSNPETTAGGLRSRTRALIKVQDGCDHYCAYCVVPYVRPRMHSRPLEDVKTELEELAAAGYKEVVLAGIRLGSYHSDGSDLPELMRIAAQIEGIKRIRLSSIEPWEVDDALVDAMQIPKVCRHMHIPLQSGDDGILEAMGRPYTAESYARLVKGVRERVEGIGITTDVMVGFPGETDEAFENTKRLVNDVAFSRLHVFRYSPRKRTRAARMADRIDSSTKRARSQELIALGRQLARDFAESFVGQTLDVLIERKTGRIQRFVGYADNYVEVIFEADRACRGQIVPVRITGVDQDGKARGRLSV